MIGRIKGQLIEKKIDSVVIDVHGIGYVVYVTEKTARSLTLDNQLGDISLRRVLWIGLVGAAGMFTVLWLALGLFLINTKFLILIYLRPIILLFI